MNKIYEAIPAILEAVDAIGKNRQNKQQGFSFRGIDDVYNMLHPLLAKHKVFPTCQVLDVTRCERETKSGGVMYCVTVKAKYTLYAEDGSSVCTEAISEGMDTADKATNKAMSGCYKYAMFQLLCIPTEAIDPDAETPEPVKSRREPLPVAGRAPSPGAETVKQKAKEADQELTPEEQVFVTDCTATIAAAATTDELLKNVGKILPSKSMRVRNQLRPLYVARQQLLKSQEVPSNA